jgi:hypothetical protein
LQVVGKLPKRVYAFNEFFASCRAREEFDRAAMTSAMDRSSHFHGYLINAGRHYPHN